MNKDLRSLVLRSSAIEEVRELMREDEEFVNTEWKGCPLLVYACEFNFDLAIFLIKNSEKLEINKMGTRGTPILSALSFNKQSDAVASRIEVAEALLAKGARVNHRNQLGETPLMEAAAHGFHDFVLLLLEHDKEQVTINLKTTSGRTALFYGAVAGEIKSIKCLLRFKASLELKDVQKSSVFHVVNSVECADLLWNELVATLQPLKNSPSYRYDSIPLNTEGSQECTQNLSVLRGLHSNFLVDCNMYGLSPLSRSTLYRNDALSRFFINKWISMRLKDRRQNTALHVVCGTFSKGMTRAHDQELFAGWLEVLFNDENCDPNQKNSEGFTSLHLIANNSASTEVFLNKVLCFNVQVWPDYHTQNAVMQALTKSNFIIKENPITCFFLVLWSSFDAWGPRDTSKHIRILSETFEETAYITCLESKSPLLLLIQAACALGHHSKYQQECERKFNEIRTRLLELITQTLDCLANNDLKSTLLIFGGTQHDPFAFMKQGPFKWALRYGQEEFLSDPRSIEATNYAAGSYRLEHALVSPSLEWARIWNENDAWEFSMYRRLPVLRAYVSFVLHFVLLLITYCEIFNENSENWILRVFLYGYIIGYTIHEIHQIQLQEDYLGEVWNRLDLAILILYLSWGIIQILCPSLSSLEGKAILTLNSFLVLFRTLHFSAFHKATAVLVDNLFAMLRNVVEFLLIFLIFLFGFAVIFTVLFNDEAGFESLQTTWLTLFSANLGNFDFSVFDGESDSTRALGIAVLITFIVVSSLVLMNMLIAIMSETFSRASEKRYEKGNRLFAEFVLEFWHDESEMHWLPAPLCLMNPIIALFTYFGFKNTANFLIKLVDFTVAVIIVVPFCFCIRTFNVVTVRWTPIGQNTLLSVLRIWWCAFLTPLLFTVWFILEGVSYWKTSSGGGLQYFTGTLLRLLNPLPQLEKPTEQIAVDGYWVSTSGNTFLSILFDYKSGWGEGVIAHLDEEIYNIEINEIPQSTNTYEIHIPRWGQTYTIFLSEKNKIQNFPAWATSGDWHKQDELECIPRLQKIAGADGMDKEWIQSLIMNHCKKLEQKQIFGMDNTAPNPLDASFDMGEDAVQFESLRAVLRKLITIRKVCENKETEDL